ncbi:MAG: aspartate/glutamate racemase family protein [Rhodobacteraceae bacterium]|nr:aspartate/glutamate racemase family protein [Paracoccaceae bacterium]
MDLAFSRDEGWGARANLGLIVLQTDETLENELRSLTLPQGTALHHTRIESDLQVTAETLMQMKENLTKSASMLPSSKAYDVIGFGCTSGSTVIGTTEVAKAVQKAHPRAKVTNPAEAVLAALRSLNIKKVGLVSPYIAEVSDALCDLLRKNQIEPVAVGSFGQSEEAIVTQISDQSVEDAICKIGQNPEVEAVFASCTNLRTFKVIEACEKKIGKPVISSNQALVWHMLKQAGLETSGQGPGQLFT